ncbi:MAG TPA: hypothetical protein VIM69_10550 [Opitutaceae bacterium]
MTLIGGDLACEIPSPSGGTQHITIPLSLDGLRILKRILSAPSHRDFGAKLGTDCEPTQALVNEWLKAERQRQRESEAKILDDLELEIDL